MPDRLVIPEILDHLPPDDPEAIRSRRDLRVINFLMGNDRWILKTAAQFPAAIQKGITEIGAGDGTLTNKLAARFPQAPITALDLAPRPAHLDPRIDWQQGDIFESPQPPSGGILIANLFLHHFEGEPLKRLGDLCKNFDHLIFSEPERGDGPHFFGKLIHPIVNRVTIHDMHISIDAGFQSSELTDLMGLTKKYWQIQQHSAWRGAHRVLGSRV